MFYSFLLFFCIYLPFQLAINPATGIDLASGRVFILLLAFFWLLEGLKNRKIIIAPTIQTFLVFSFLFFSALSLVVAQNTDWSLRKLAFLFSIFPLYFIVSAIARNQKIARNILKFLVWGAGLSAFIGILQFALQFIIGLENSLHFWSFLITPFLGKSFSQAVFANPSWLVNISGVTVFRSVSLFPDPHMFSFYLGLMLPWAFVFYFFSKKRELVYLGIFFLILTADLLTFSRGGYMGILAGFLFSILFFWNRIKVNYRKALVFALIMISLAAIIPNPVSRRLVSSFDLTEGSNLGRIETWKSSLGIIKSNPLLGVGLGNYPLEIKPSADYREPIYSHSLYLDIAAETGVVNAFFWITLLMAAFISYIKLGKKDLFYLGGAVSLIIFSIHSIFETPLFSPRILPLLLTIVALSNLKISDE